MPFEPRVWSALLWATSVLVLFTSLAPARADPIADFYNGKTVYLLIGVGVGGEYDLQARLIARHLGKHIPGNPAIVPQNMTGASGLKEFNYLANVAPKDGTYIGIIQNALPAMQAVGLDGVQFDATKFFWLGTMAPVVETMAVWHTTGVTSIEGARGKQIVAGSTARGSITYTYAAMMNEFLGTRFKIVTGYTGGNQINLAMERGEVEARNNSWSSWKATHPAWLAEKKLTVIAQAGPRAPDLDAPSVEDLAPPADRPIIELVVSGTQLGRPLAITPGVPPERVAALRSAFDATMKDPAFLAEAKAMNFDVDPVSGEAMQKVIARIMATPKDLAAKAKHLLE